MGHTLTWVRRAGALRTDALEGPFTYVPALEDGDQHFSIPVGTYNVHVGKYFLGASVLGDAFPPAPEGYVPPSYTMPVYRGAEYADSPPAFPDDPPFRMAPRGGSQQYEERPRKIGKKKAREIEATRESILIKARGKDQRMKDWKTKANKMLDDLGWDPVSAEESQREQRRRRNAAAHSRKKGRDRDIVGGSPFSPDARTMSPEQIADVRIVGGMRSDLGLSPLQEAVLDHAQRISGRNMRRSI